MLKCVIGLCLCLVCVLLKYFDCVKYLHVYATISIRQGCSPKMTGSILHLYLPIIATFLCTQGGHCREVLLYLNSLKTSSKFHLSFPIIFGNFCKVPRSAANPRSISFKIETNGNETNKTRVCSFGIMIWKKI